MSIPEVALLSQDSSRKVGLEEVRRYWESHVHDIARSAQAIGSLEFFHDLERYHFEKLSYLPRLVNFSDYRGKKVLEIGCGIGTDLVRFAEFGAVVTGVDLAPKAVDLAKKNFVHRGIQADLRVMNGERLAFDENSFDLVYAHGVLQYTSDPLRMIQELYRVLRVSGEAMITVYNRYSWLNLLSHLTNVELEHADAPVFVKHSVREFRRLLTEFSKIEIFVERFPVKTKLHRGMKARLYNEIFVGLFNCLPRPLVRPFGWHIVAKAVK